MQVRRGLLSRVEDDTAAGKYYIPRYLTTHDEGIKITGGSDAAVGRGIYESSGAIAFAVDGFGRATIGSSTASFYTSPNTDYAITAGQSNNSVTNLFGVNESIDGPVLIAACSTLTWTLTQANLLIDLSIMQLIAELLKALLKKSMDLKSTQLLVKVLIVTTVFILT